MNDAAIGIIFEKNSQKVLLIKREDTPIWVLPGGGIESDESAEEAVVREVKEETGIEVSVIRKCAEYLPINSLASKTTIFECLPLDGTLTIGEETREIGFFSLDHLPKPFFFIHEEWLKEIVGSKGKLIQKPITQVTIKNIIFFFLRHPIIFLKFAFKKSMLNN